MNKLRHAYNRTLEVLGVSYLSIDFINFVKVHSLFFFSFAMSNVFITTFIMRSGGTLLTVSQFVLVSFCFEMFAYLFMPMMSNYLKRTLIASLGLVSFAAAYVALLILNDSMDKYFPIVAVFNAFGASFYYGCYHGSVGSYTTADNRQTGMSLLGVTSNAITLIAPLISGFFTSMLPDTTGYIVIFSITLLLLILAFIKSRVLPSAVSRETKNSIHGFFKRFGKEKAVRYMLLGMGFFGVRECLFMYYLNIVLFQFVNDELAIGATTTAKGIMAILLYFVMSKKMTPRLRIGGSFFMYAAMLILSVSLAVSIEQFPVFAVIVVVFVSVMDNALMLFVMNSLQHSAYEVLGYFMQRSPGEQLQLMFMPVRNMALNAGRFLGMAFYFLLPFPQGSAWPLVVITVASFPSAVFIVLSDRRFKKLTQAEQIDGLCK